MRNNIDRPDGYSDRLAENLSFLATVSVKLDVTPIEESSTEFENVRALLLGRDHISTTGKVWTGRQVNDWISTGGKLLAVFVDSRTPAFGPVGAVLYRGGEIEQVVIENRASSSRVLNILIDSVLRDTVATGSNECTIRIEDSPARSLFVKELTRVGFTSAGDDSWVHTSAHTRGNSDS